MQCLFLTGKTSKQNTFMKAFVKGAALLLGVGLLSTHAQAQKVIIKDEEPNSILFISRDKAGDEIIRILNETQNQRFHEGRCTAVI